MDRWRTTGRRTGSVSPGNAGRSAARYLAGRTLGVRHAARDLAVVAAAQQQRAAGTIEPHLALQHEQPRVPRVRMLGQHRCGGMSRVSTSRKPSSPRTRRNSVSSIVTRLAPPSPGLRPCAPCARACRRRWPAQRPLSNSSFGLPPRPLPITCRLSAKVATETSGDFASTSISVRPLPPLDCSFSSSSAKHEQPAVQRQAGHLRVRVRDGHRRQHAVGRLEREEALAALVAAVQVTRLGQQAEAAGVGQQQRRCRPRRQSSAPAACRLPGRSAS